MVHIQNGGKRQHRRFFVVVFILESESEMYLFDHYKHNFNDNNNIQLTIMDEGTQTDCNSQQ